MKERLPRDLERIVSRASRVIRLARLRAPAIILVETEQSLRKAVDGHARAVGGDPDTWRSARAADQAELENTPLTEEDEAELRRMESEVAAYDAAEPVAMTKWLAEFFDPLKAPPEIGPRLWQLLDSSYRSDRVYAEMESAEAQS